MLFWEMAATSLSIANRRGIKNSKNNCYQICVLQALCGEPTLFGFLCNSKVDDQVNNESKYEGAVVRKVGKLFKDLFSCDKEPVNIEGMLALFSGIDARYDGQSQEDAHEFLVALLSWLHEDLKVLEFSEHMVNSSWNLQLLYEGEYSFIMELFSTEIHSIVTCGKCSHVSVSPQHYLVISLPLLPNSSCSLEDLIENFTSPESLHEFKCHNCSSPDSCQKRLSFHRLPPVLIFHFARFTFTENEEVCKNNTAIDYPMVCEINGQKYELCSAIMHLGQQASSGHYITKCKSDFGPTSSGHWWSVCNDDSVEWVEETCYSGSSTSVYILLYRIKFAPEHPQSPYDKSPPEIDTSFQEQNKPHIGKRRKQKSIVQASKSDLLNAVNARFAGEGELIQSCCMDPSLDEIDPLVTEDDIEGATINMENIYKLGKKALEWWLLCRGLPVNGRKQELIERILNHVKQGKGQRIDPKLEGGKYLMLKRQKTAELSKGAIHNAPPVPVTGWKTFPSSFPQDLFNVNHAINYALERAHTLPSQTPEADSGKDDDAIFERQSLKRFKTIPNPLNKGIQFLTSCNIRNVWDQDKGEHYFVKAEVEPSMHGPTHIVTVTMSATTGYICQATCRPCKQQESARCSHICAVLLLLAGFGHNDEGGETTTSRPQYWGHGGQRKDPGIFRNKKYYSGMNVYNRATFDPRPSQFKEGPSSDSLDKLKEKVKGKTILALQMQQQAPLLEDNIEDNPPEVTTDQVVESCKAVFEFMKSAYHKDHPSEIIGTSGQSNSEQWHLNRSIRATASEAKVIHGLGGKKSSMDGKKNFLRRHMWGIHHLNDLPAMKYGKENESTARDEYVALMRQEEPHLEVSECGMWVNPKFPQLSCSPDGLVISPNRSVRLLEIKCPISMKDFDPSSFDENLSIKQKQSTFVKREKNGSISLKTTSGYYYQVQMSMDILELKECHFFVWTPKGSLLLVIPYSEEFWKPIRSSIIEIHRKLILPEYFLKNAYNNLHPLILEY